MISRHQIRLSAEEAVAFEAFAWFEEPAWAAVDDFVALEDELGEDEVAVRVVDFHAGEVAPDLVLPVVIEAAGEPAVGGCFRNAVGDLGKFFAEDDEFGPIPGLSGPTEVAPELGAVDEATATNKVVTLGLGGDGGIALRDLGGELAGAGTSGEEQQSDEE